MIIIMTHLSGIFSSFSETLQMLGLPQKNVPFCEKRPHDADGTAQKQLPTLLSGGILYTPRPLKDPKNRGFFMHAFEERFDSPDLVDFVSMTEFTSLAGRSGARVSQSLKGKSLSLRAKSYRRS